MFDFAFLLTAVLLVVIDGVYLNLMKGYFMKQVEDVQGSKLSLNFVSAIICYVFLVSGLYYFIIKPRRSISDAFLLGLVIYGVYETTNLAMFKNWSILTVLMDTLWGAVLFAVTAYLIKILTGKL